MKYKGREYVEIPIEGISFEKGKPAFRAGIDVGSKQEIYKLINRLAEQGKAIIVISSEMEELLGLTDRMLVLYEGKCTGKLEKEEYSQEKVLQYASGELSL